jgi:hypothetical protein
MLTKRWSNWRSRVRFACGNLQFDLTGNFFRHDCSCIAKEAVSNQLSVLRIELNADG